MGAASKKPDEPPAFKTPDRRADLVAGQTVYTERCSICHGADGGGLLATEDARKGYLFPALWGPDSYNDGAGMARVLTAARFIKASMPLGQPDLTDDEAFDVAAFINSQPRPEMPNLENDYPDRALKPIDNGYGPYADNFPRGPAQVRAVQTYRGLLQVPEEDEVATVVSASARGAGCRPPPRAGFCRLTMSAVACRGPVRPSRPMTPTPAAS